MTSEKQPKEESLAGDHEAESLFDSDLKPFIEAVFWKRCSDERSRQKASDIAADVISDCFGATVRPRGDDRLLNLYNGRVPLKQWLATAAISRLKNWWRSGQWRFEQQAEELETVNSPTDFAAESVTQDPEIAVLLADALRWAFLHLEPQKAVFLRLAYLYDVKRERIARMWGCHPSTIGREITIGLMTLRARTLEYLRRADPFLEIEWQDCLEVCTMSPRLLYGDDKRKALREGSCKCWGLVRDGAERIFQ
jgi:DNA-directed RNA polymerase specialized sigma24 family protein